MKAAEKALLWEMLKKTSAAVTGYSGEAFASEPNFLDDPEIPESQNSLAGQNAASAIQNFSQAQGAYPKSQNFSQAQEGAAPLSDDNSSPAPAGASIDSIAQKIASCSRCPLCQTRKNVVPGEGVSNPLVLVVGEGPGADEDAQGRPFVGRAGQLLDKMLSAISLSRQKNCFIANVVKCRPPMNRDPAPQEAAACRSFLDAQIHVLKPKMILAVGRVALQNLLDTSIGINKMRGQIVDFKGIPFMATYHPSALLREESLKRPTWEDLKAFRQRLLQIAPDYDK